MSFPTEINHVELGLERNLSQWKDSPNLQGLFQSFLEQSDVLEDVLFQILQDRGIYEAVGEQLDVIGALFGIDRGNKTDEQYRAAILQKISTINTDGTSEVFMQVLRNISNSSFVDFWEHDSGDVHAFLGDGFNFNTYPDLEDLVPAGVSLRVYVDDEADSFVGSEIQQIISDLQTNNNEDIQVTDGVDTFDLQVQTGEIDDTNAELAILPEIVDNIETPYLAELLFSGVTTVSGLFVDNEGNFIIDNDNDNIIWTDYTF